jgi:hypothetical protein
MSVFFAKMFNGLLFPSSILVITVIDAAVLPMCPMRLWWHLHGISGMCFMMAMDIRLLLENHLKAKQWRCKRRSWSKSVSTFYKTVLTQKATDLNFPVK